MMLASVPCRYPSLSMSGLTMISRTSVSFIVSKLGACAMYRFRKVMSEHFCTYECRASAQQFAGLAVLPVDAVGGRLYRWEDKGTSLVTVSFPLPAPFPLLPAARRVMRTAFTVTNRRSSSSAAEIPKAYGISGVRVLSSAACSIPIGISSKQSKWLP